MKDDTDSVGNERDRAPGSHGNHDAGTVTIIVLAKLPVPGRVKTRMCPPCLPAEAAQIAEASLRDTLAAVTATHASHPELIRDVVVSLERLGTVTPDWIAAAGHIVDQCDGDLSDRLGHAFAAVEGPAILIGMDTPQVSPTLLAAAASCLLGGDHDSLIGAATDGGFWIIGFRSCPSNVFRGVSMSTDRTGSEQLGAMIREGLDPVAFAVLSDFDTFDDAVMVAEPLAGSETRAAVQRVAERIRMSERTKQGDHSQHAETRDAVTHISAAAPALSERQ